ncbi:agmatine deiminase family protein [Pseudoalteromonas sp. T1lg48]|uniref:agmatine deiminase family protein n=1 Tax=Pseudoalteromonas sp. T1lg48 TaxID=2077100 RepID=UPI000CF71827|nr:agmatine deiminase family protein [Pseudoalteromonas sp. T1lg48]
MSIPKKRPTLVPASLASEVSQLVKELPNTVYHNDTPSCVTAVAEFAPMGGVLIAYPGTVAPSQPQFPPSGPRAFGIPNELIVRMQQNDTSNPVHIFVMCGDESQKQNIDKELSETASALGLTYNPEHLHIVPWDTDTFWTRDFGPWWVHNKDSDYYGITKHTYTTLGGGEVGLVEGAENVSPKEGLGIFRPNDDYGAVKFSDFLNNPIRQWNKARWHKENPTKLTPIKVHNFYYSGLLDVGGNYMVDGKGNIASTYLVATQNELPTHNEQDLYGNAPAIIEKRMKYILEQLNRFMGISSYRVLEDPTGTYIGHIDCWGKFLSEDKVLIAQSENADINQKLNHIADNFEQEYQVYRVLCQDMYIPNADEPATTAAYTNSLILNNFAYVPLSGKGYEKYDEAALATYRTALPNHTVIGIESKPEFPWLGTDAMHCRTRGVPRQVVDNWLASLKPTHP